MQPPVSFINKQTNKQRVDIYYRFPVIGSSHMIWLACGNCCYCCSCVFWLGDLNFRINELKREDVIKRINKKRHHELLKYDQVSWLVVLYN